MVNMILYILFGFLLLLSGCTSYDACIAQCEDINTDMYDDFRYECRAAIDVRYWTWRDYFACNSEAYWQVKEYCHDDCKCGVSYD